MKFHPEMSVGIAVGTGCVPVGVVKVVVGGWLVVKVVVCGVVVGAVVVTPVGAPGKHWWYQLLTTSQCHAEGHCVAPVHPEPPH